MLKLCLAAGFTAIAALAGAAQPMTLARLPAMIPRLQPLGRLAATNQLHLALALPLRNPDDLARLLGQIYDPASPEYRHYLTPAEFTARFGPTEKDYQAVMNFAKANGLKIAATQGNRRLLDVTGQVTAIEQAFHVVLQNYRHPAEHRLFYAPDTAPSIPTNVPIQEIIGLDNFELPHPGLRPEPNGQSAPAIGGSGSGGNFLGYDFRHAYAPGVGMTGTGQKIGLLELDGYYGNDITSYAQQSGLPPPSLTNTLVDGFSGTPTTNANSVAEVSLDIEMAMDMAPDATIQVFEAPNTIAAFVDLLNAMAADTNIAQFSSSWGFIPYPGDPRVTMDTILEEMAAQGQSFFQASGDGDAWVNAIWVPAASPYLTSVGGTRLNMYNAGGSYAWETVWNSGSNSTPWFANGGGYWGSGGGVSSNYAIPTWQQGVNMAAVSGSTTQRNIPDVALTATQIWVIYDNGFSGPFMGTSCAAPLWAGFTALVNQRSQGNGQASVGFLNPFLYAQGLTNDASAFHDVTAGNDTSYVSPTNYYAAAGYDLCTGWGTPNGTNFINALAPEALQIGPSAGLAAIGYTGGVFSAASDQVNLTNSGAAALTWGGGADVTWLSLSTAQGTLAGGGTGTTTVATAAGAETLAPGSYMANVWITNLNDETPRSIPFTLTVLHWPVISSEPTNQTVLAGNTAQFSVTASGDLPLLYQWRLNGQDIFGATGSTLTVPDVQSNSAGNYDAVISSSGVIGSITSSVANLTVVWPPQVTSQSPDQRARVSGAVTFFVTVSGTPPFDYQWQFNGADIAGATNATLTLLNVEFTNAGQYQAVISNPYAVITNSAIRLTVMGAPYTITDLGTLGGTNSSAAAINDLGQIVGSAGTVDGSTHAFLFTNGILRDLGTLGGTNSAANAINNSGVIVGWADNSNGMACAFVNSNGVMSDLGITRSTGQPSFANAINDAGQIAGTYDLNTTTPDAFLFSGGGLYGLGALPGYALSQGQAINEDGAIAGSCQTTAGGYPYHAAVWTPSQTNGVSGTWMDLEIPGLFPTNSSPGDIHNNGSGWGINDSGLVAGMASVSNNYYHAFVYVNGAMEDLGLDGFVSAKALHVNNAGQIVGYLGTDLIGNGGGIHHAFTWDSVQGMRDLNTLIDTNSGWFLSEAAGLNDNGQVVGVGVISNQAHAFVLNTTTLSVTRLIPAGGGGHPFDFMDVYFSGPVLDGGFTLADVSMVDASGHSITPLSLFKVSATEYEIDFSGLTGQSSYTLTIGPGVLDANGEPMDQNHNWIPGEPGDAYVAS
ncbi:MAG: immunoglobulin domain-containing protein, partial [Verrucomicrobia bacterium]|nr:immunoglobulin domain-containing protein [Verrucomicrobiota bacterium]